MIRSTRPLAAFAAALTLLAAAPAFAATPQAGGTAQPGAKHPDFHGQRPQPLGFKDIDADHDGSVTREELKAAMEKHRPANAPANASMPSTDDMVQRLFARADANGDGKLSEAEFKNAHPQGGHGRRGRADASGKAGR